MLSPLYTRDDYSRCVELSHSHREATPCATHKMMCAICGVLLRVGSLSAHKHAHGRSCWVMRVQSLRQSKFAPDAYRSTTLRIYTRRKADCCFRTRSFCALFGSFAPFVFLTEKGTLGFLQSAYAPSKALFSFSRV